MPYEMSEAAKRFLRRKYAADRDLEKCCDCPGCDTCTGFKRNCPCDKTRLTYFTNIEAHNAEKPTGPETEL